MSQTTPIPSSGGGGHPVLPSSGDSPRSPDTLASPDRELESLRQEVAGLKAALASRATIDQARGILIARYRISPDQAFRVLVRWSQHRNIKLRVIAESLVGLSQDGPDAPDIDPDLRQWLRQQLAAPSAADYADSEEWGRTSRQ